MRIFSSVRRNVTMFTVATLALVAIVAGTAFAGWGPSRPTFTWTNTATYVTFNSITDNPQVGDERPFLSGKVTSASGNVVDNIQVNDNDEVSLRVYFHNNAAANLNLTATNTRVSILLPRTSATTTFASSYISADNANPRIVSDSVDFSGVRPFTLEYIPGSARLTNNVFTSGTSLSDNIVTPAGALVGYNAIDGNVPGCGQFSGFVTMKVRVKMPGAPVPPTPPTPTPSPKAPEVPQAPQKLPDTGPAGVVGLFAGVSALTGAGHYIVARRRG